VAAERAAVSSTRSRWIVSPRFDLAVFILSAAVTAIPWIAVDHLHVHPFYILAAVAVSANGPHLVSTWTRVYLDGSERWRRPIAYFVVPGLLAAFVLTVILVDGASTSWLRTILFYWAAWHFMAQCWGLLRIYQRKHGVAETRGALVEKALLFGGCSWCVLHRLFTGPWTLFGGWVFHPSPPAWLVNGTGAAVATLAIFDLGRRIVEWRRGSRVDLQRPAFILSSVGAFAVPFLVIRDGTAAFAAAAAWHAIQYLGIVWFYNRNRYREGLDSRAKMVSFVSQPRRAPLYFALLLALAGAAYLALLGAARATVGTSWDFGAWSLFVWTSLTFGHYWLDGVIWKLRKDRELVVRLEATTSIG
jgi:hypothetical protein